MSKIQIILIVPMLIAVIKLFKGAGAGAIKAGKKILMLLFVLTMVAFIIFPESSNFIAGLVGVGRGADLLTYLLAIAFTLQSFNSYIISKKQSLRVTQLARNSAIAEALANNKHAPKF
jgi:hypothetical protein